jgi:hypothetical protein
MGKYFGLVILILTGCVSQEMVTQKRTELEQLKDQNLTLKNEVANFKKQHKLLRDSLGQAKQLLREKVANDNSKVPYLKFKADSVVIMQCRFASNIEKDVYNYLNYARTRPKEFCEKFVIPNWDKNNSYENSLVEKMMSLKPMGTLLPDRKLYASADCHAIVSGELGFVGHTRSVNRKTKKKCDEYFMGECISYGMEEGLAVVLQLLIDDGVPSLGHRYICLSEGFTMVGISSRKHAKYGVNCVLDFM